MSQNNTVILGAGIIGLSTAYYLSSSGTTDPGSIYLIDSSPELFQCASGRAAGFIAKDWFIPKEAALGALSFRLHRELAEEHNGLERWGYSPSSAIFLREGSGNEVESLDEETDNMMPQWLKTKEGRSVTSMGSEGTTAQIQPLRFCRFLHQEVTRRGVKEIHAAIAVSIGTNRNGILSSIDIEQGAEGRFSLACSRLVITCGAWTPQVLAKLFPSFRRLPQISPLAGYSIVVQSPHWKKFHEAKGCHAVFADPDTDSDVAPAIFSRIGEEVYVSGLDDIKDDKLPERSVDSKPKQEFLDKLHATAQRMLKTEDALEVVKSNMCYQPINAKGPAIISRIPDDRLGNGLQTEGNNRGGVFVASGHGHWGISLSLGTGKVLAELIENKSTSVNISRLRI